MDLYNFVSITKVKPECWLFGVFAFWVFVCRAPVGGYLVTVYIKPLSAFSTNTDEHDAPADDDHGDDDEEDDDKDNIAVFVTL